MADYEFHMSTIESWVFEQHKTVRKPKKSLNYSDLVTYKYVGHNLCVSSNYAKQMLFDFMNRNGNKVKSTYFVSGLAKSDQTLRIHVVKDSRLEEVERKLSTIVSKHLYSVSSTDLSDSAQLWAADRELPPHSANSTVDDWASIHEGSSVKTSFIEKRPKLLKKAPSAPIAPLSRTSSQSQSGLITRVSSTLSENESNQKDGPSATPPSLLKSPSATKPAAKKSGIMGMFAASASKAAKATTSIKSETTTSSIPNASESTESDVNRHGGISSKKSESEAVVKEEESVVSGPSSSTSPNKTSSKSPSKKTSPAKKSAGAKKTRSPGKKAGSGGLQKIDMFAKKSVAESDSEISPSQADVHGGNAMDVDVVPLEAAVASGEAMDVSEPVASHSATVSTRDVPKSLEDDLLEELEASDEERGHLSKLKKNVEEEDDPSGGKGGHVFDTDEDPFGASSKSAQVARAKKQEESKKQAKKEAAEARKKARVEAKKAEKAEEEEAKKAASADADDDGTEAKTTRKRRKRNSVHDMGSEEADAPPVVTEQRRRFDAYFGASSSASTSDHHTAHSDASASSAPTNIFDIPTTRTRTIVDVETFVNEKGYTVTREVERTIQEDISPEEQQKMREEAEAKHKKQLEADEARKAADAKKAAAKAASTAAKLSSTSVTPAAKKTSIMSFFGKK